MLVFRTEDAEVFEVECKVHHNLRLLPFLFFRPKVYKRVGGRTEPTAVGRSTAELSLSWVEGIGEGAVLLKGLVVCRELPTGT